MSLATLINSARNLAVELVPPIALRAVCRLLVGSRIPDGHLYGPLFSPWRGLGGFAALAAEAGQRTLVSPDRLWVLYSVARQALAVPGDFYEAGVFRGGTAKLLTRVLEDDRTGRTLRLFDTFAGMPETDAARDLHRAGVFAETSLEGVRAFVGEKGVSYHPGFIPATFAGREGDRIALAHVDVDIHQSVADCCAFIYPRLSPGGVMVFDDYGFPSCPGARLAVDEFFAALPEVPLVLPTGQAVVVKLP